MLINQFQVNLPNEFIPFINQVKGNRTNDERVTLFLAMGMYLTRQATLAKAAELSKRNIWEFIEVLRALGVPWGEYTEDSYMQDELTLSKLVVESV